MKFRKIRNINLSYERQGQIFFALANYRSQPPNVREKIDALIQQAAKGEECYVAALKAWLTEGKAYERVVAEYFVRGDTLVGMRKKLYESW